MKDRLEAVERSLDHLLHEADLIKTVLIVKEPESGLAANAFEGLRKQIVATAQEHWAHLAQLAIMDSMLHEVDSIADLRRISEEWLGQAGVHKVDVPTDPQRITEMFELVGDGPDVVAVLRPAYVDQATGRIIRAGRLATGDRLEGQPAQAVPEESPMPADDGDEGGATA